MNALTREWIDKAEGDFGTAGREMRARKQPNYDSADREEARSAYKAIVELRRFLQTRFAQM